MMAGVLLDREGKAYQGARPLLVQGAMKVETSHIVEQLDDLAEYRLGEWYFASGIYRGVPLAVSRTQWGLANAAATTALAMEFFRPVAVINQGTAGAHDPALQNFDIVIGKETVNISAWKSHFRARGEGVDEEALDKLGVLAYDKEARRFTQEVCHKADEGLFYAAAALKDRYTKGRVTEGVIGTADSWNCQVDRVLFLHDFYGTAVEEMEGDAVAQICQTYDVPFLAIRVVSNTVFAGDVDWDLAVGAALQEYVLAVAEEYMNMR